MQGRACGLRCHALYHLRAQMAETAKDWAHQLGFAGIVALTVYVILDIEYPRVGWIRVDAIDQVLIGVRAGMK